MVGTPPHSGKLRGKKEQIRTKGEKRNTILELCSWRAKTSGKAQMTDIAIRFWRGLDRTEFCLLYNETLAPAPLNQTWSELLPVVSRWARRGGKRPTQPYSPSWTTPNCRVRGLPLFPSGRLTFRNLCLYWPENYKRWNIMASLIHLIRMNSKKPAVISSILRGPATWKELSFHVDEDKSTGAQIHIIWSIIYSLPFLYHQMPTICFPPKILGPYVLCYNTYY